MIPAALIALATPALPQTVAEISPAHQLVEGVASDGKTIWVSSVLDRTIIACRRLCNDLVVLPPGLHPLGIAWDSKRQRLWIAADCPALPQIATCDRGALLAIDRHGKLRTRIAPFVGEFHPGDVSASDGEVFVSDSQNGMVFRLVSNDRAIMAVVLPGVGKSAQGTALDASGTRLVVADYSQGIGITGIETFKRTLLAGQDGKSLRGIDGLARCGDTFFGVYNGSAPGRILTFRLRSEGVEYGELVDDLRLPDPTQIAFDGKRLLIIADAGWEAAGKGTTRTEGAPILAISLGKHCKPL